MTNTVLYAAAAVLLLLLLLLILLRKNEGTEIVYEDLSDAHSCRPLFSETYALAGKPDLLLRRNGQLIPLELKHMNAPLSPYEGNVMQLMAYCLLLEDICGEVPPYGILKYRDKSYKISYTKARKKELLRVMERMRREHTCFHRSHQSAVRCKVCGFRGYCNEKINGDE